MRAPLVVIGLPLLACALAGPPARAATPADTVRADPARHAWMAGTVRPDRLQHASLAFTLGLGSGLASRRPGVALAGTVALAAAKEARDARTGGRFDPGDLAAGALGAVLAAMLTRAID